MQTLCRCGSKKESKECCELIIRGTKEAKTAEELMRSRYLQIIKTKEGREQDETGFVEFKALYIEDGKLQHIHENSFFKLENSKWVYVSGEFLT
jgi:SEC-C motif-containing protein